MGGQDDVWGGGPVAVVWSVQWLPRTVGIGHRRPVHGDVVPGAGLKGGFVVVETTCACASRP